MNIHPRVLQVIHTDEVEACKTLTFARQDGFQRYIYRSTLDGQAAWSNGFFCGVGEPPFKDLGDADKHYDNFDGPLAESMKSDRPTVEAVPVGEIGAHNRDLHPALVLVTADARVVTVINARAFGYFHQRHGDGIRWFVRDGKTVVDVYSGPQRVGAIMPLRLPGMADDISAKFGLPMIQCLVIPKTNQIVTTQLALFRAGVLRGMIGELVHLADGMPDDIKRVVGDHATVIAFDDRFCQCRTPDCAGKATEVESVPFYTCTTCSKASPVVKTIAWETR